MSKSFSYKLELDPLDKIALRRNLNKDGKAQQFLTHEIRRLADPYVPFRTGALKNTAVERVDHIIYVQPYSKKNWDDNPGHGGKRGRLWIPRMWADRGKEIVKSVANYVGGRAK